MVKMPHGTPAALQASSTVLQACSWRASTLGKPPSEIARSPVPISTKSIPLVLAIAAALCTPRCVSIITPTTVRSFAAA